MLLTGIKITGFKSFGRTLELGFSSGITAIVGPNGCGKSNLTEAIRWLMGESSVRRLRGGEMDEILFSGTDSESPSRFCSVEAHFNPHYPTFDPKWRDYDSIAIRRRYDRNHGSQYSINGTPKRAKDVQVFFADLGSGASSHSIVAQGRIAVLIEQSSQDRYHLLEEAAGTKGLAVRRKESLSKLRSAESNLLTASELLEVQQQQYQTLRRQSIQAQEYRKLGEQITVTQGALNFRNWQDTSAKINDFTDRLQRLQNKQNHLEQQEADIYQRLITLRSSAQAETERVYQKEHAIKALQLEISNARQQEQVNERRVQELGLQLQTTVADIKFSQQRVNKLQQMQNEHIAQATQLLSDAEHQQQLQRQQQEIDKLSSELVATEQRRTQQQQQLQTMLAQQRKYNEQQEAIRYQQASCQAILDQTTTEQQGLQVSRKHKLQEQANLVSVQAAQAAKVKELKQLNKAAQLQLQEQQATVIQAQHKYQQQQQQQRAASATTLEELKTVNAEIAGLTKLLQRLRAGSSAKGGQNNGDKQLNQLRLQFNNELYQEYKQNYQQALAAALGEDINANLMSSGKYYWRDVESKLQPLPSGRHLAEFITSPNCLRGRLAASIVADDLAAAQQLLAQLPAGYRVVTKDGWCVTEDGLTRHISSLTGGLQALETEARLHELNTRHGEITRQQQVLEQQAETKLTALATEVQQLELELQHLTDQQLEFRTELEKSQQQLVTINDKLKKVEVEIHLSAERYDKLHQRLTTTKHQLSKNNETYQQITEKNNSVSEQAIEQVQQQIAQLQNNEQQQQQALQGKRLALEQTRVLQQQNQLRRKDWQQRSEWIEHELAENNQRIGILTITETKTTDELQSLQQQSDRAAFIQEREQQQQQLRLEYQDLLAKAERQQVEEQELNKSQHDCQQQLQQLSSKTGALSERLNNLRAQLTTIDSEMHNICGCKAADFPDQFPEYPQAEAASLTRQLAELNARRSALGSVNLLAADQVEELHRTLTESEAQKADLESAINKLTTAVARIDSEAKVRLSNTYEKLQKLFVSNYRKLFAGGRARLELVENENVWDSGLEIYATPPGKRQTSLSLLSGGEQALTAIALLIAAYQLSNSPLCVLDEVDAALDDSNVDKLLNLLTDIFVANNKLTCLIVTHHRKTMSRADRLLGVTMPQPGNTQIVDVDIRAAEKFAKVAVAN